MTTELCQNSRLSSPSIFTAVTDCSLSFFLRVWDFESPYEDLCLALWAGVCLVSSVWCWGLSWTCQTPSTSIILHMTKGNGPLAFWVQSPFGVLHLGLCLPLIYMLWCPGVDWFLAHNHGCMYTTRLDFLQSWPNFSCLGFAMTEHTSRGNIHSP